MQRNRDFCLVTFTARYVVMVSSLGCAYMDWFDKAMRSCWLQCGAQPSAWNPSQFKQGCHWNRLMLSLGLIHTFHVHHRGFIPSVSFGSGPTACPGLGQSLHIALQTVGIPVVVCSIGVAWRNNGHQIKNELGRICFLYPFSCPLASTSVFFCRLIYPCFCDTNYIYLLYCIYIIFIIVQNTPISFFFSL